MSIKIQELQKGQRVQLDNGWFATLKGKPGNKTTVLAEVEGFFTEIGSVYCHDIVGAEIDGSGRYDSVEHTPKQNKLRASIQDFYGGEAL
jgi:hypothetical protein